MGVVRGAMTIMACCLAVSAAVKFMTGEPIGGGMFVAAALCGIVAAIMAGAGR